MPLKATDSNSTLASQGSGEKVVVQDMRGPNSGPRRTQAPVIVHNQGGQIYDETRPSDWDKQRWK
ncbi:hypothetical protein ASPWEDRAFT_110971 [Aspergillus wentii DTO 134E9]|uniref:Uncharacterized protein n=1 Tax=Aspergillus wentii DTO 134E9 TaxID=1073089 RepID=A0A1L9RKU2_ASPWE|nr:uncharacterized protein ASPWEDRAFT_110971 [Aspergillus wentii DTO 134E9]KAI9924677.1 hypothetical protein MW887_006952 [Aspergillus wentii]OJJ35556.1 hypothetical protein ASPWEDRAFT_110971 [Aspergillus wentii DTO 134E9]